MQRLLCAQYFAASGFYTQAALTRSGVKGTCRRRAPVGKGCRGRTHGLLGEMPVYYFSPTKRLVKFLLLQLKFIHSTVWHLPAV